MKRTQILLAITLCFASNSHATDFSSCKFWDEKCKIDRIKTEREGSKAAELERVEQYKRDRAERDAAREVENQEKVNEAANNQAAYKEYERAEAERRLKESDEKYAKMKAEQAAATAEQEKEDYKLNAAADRADRAAQKKVNLVKAKCGEDYKNPQIGMTLARVKECVGPVKLVSQVNRKDGVANMYQYGSLTLNVMDGHVVAWTR